jgi:hypothetical protein
MNIPSLDCLISSFPCRCCVGLVSHTYPAVNHDQINHHTEVLIGWTRSFSIACFLSRHLDFILVVLKIVVELLHFDVCHIYDAFSLSGNYGEKWI